jgi:predicted dehydrogenase
MRTPNILLLGVGYMGKEYYKVLRDMPYPVTVVGNSNLGIEQFSAETDGVAYMGGVKGNREFINNAGITHAIIATPVHTLKEVTLDCLQLGIKNILIEKPAGKTPDEVTELAKLEIEYGANIFVACNRRFFASVNTLLGMLDEQRETISSVRFEFTEWISQIYKMHKEDKVHNNIFFTNSIHVIDLAFFFAGMPKEISAFTAEQNYWTDDKLRYAGAGITKNNVLFSYLADWKSPGRWAVEVITNDTRYYLQPMETLQIQKKDSVKVDLVEIEDALDRRYKPGLYAMVDTFLHGGEKKNRLLTLKEHNDMMWVYKKMME